MTDASTGAILGIDPGLRFTGWGVVVRSPFGLVYGGHGTIRVPVGGPTAERLQRLFEGVQAVLHDIMPSVVAVEEVFTIPNGASTMKLCMARGVAILAPALLKIPVAEYAANAVKKAVTGDGHAGKERVAEMVQHLLMDFPAEPQRGRGDGTDALAIALCHAQTSWLAAAS